MSSDFSRTLALLCLAAFFASCGGGGSGGGDPAPPPPPAAAVTSVAVTCTSTALQTSGTTQCMANVQGTGAFNTAVQWQVHLLYVVASDGEDRELDTNGAVERSVEAWNEWLGSQTSGRRLRLDRSQGALDVTFVRLDRTDAELNAFGAFIRDHMEAELILKGFNDPEKIYAVYYDGGDEQTGVCGDGPWPGPVTRWIGGLGHELGHAFTLPHPPGCDEGLRTCDYDALMHLGFEMYPDTYLRPDNKETLLRSPFVGRDPAHRPLTEDTVDTSAIRGTVTDPEGNALGGIRVSAVADSFWSWSETASDGTFEILLPAGSAGSSFLSVHTSGNADCGWLGYYRAGGLTTLRERAVPIRLGETDAASIEIRLPDFPGQLCTGQRIVSGAVLGPDGEPVGLWVGGGLFDTWNWTGTDGRFEIRQPTVASTLWINTAQCGNIGYYADGGVTTRLADAAPFALGGVDETDIQIRLSHTTAELCSRQIVISGTVVGPHSDAIEGIIVESQPFRRGDSSGPDGAFELRLLEGTTGVAVLAITATCGRVGYYGPNGFTASRKDATEIEIGQGNVAGIEIRLPVDVNDLCVSIGVEN